MSEEAPVKGKREVRGINTLVRNGVVRLCVPGQRRAERKTSRGKSPLSVSVD